MLSSLCLRILFPDKNVKQVTEMSKTVDTKQDKTLGWPKMAQMCRSYWDQWFSHLTYLVGEENALKPQKSKCLSPALFILRYAAF